jgi:hypothetical protein
MKLLHGTHLDLNKFDFFYKNSSYLGASTLLKKFLKLDPNILIPASVSHGVDYYHSHFAQDIDAIEPLHWSCRKDIDHVKPTFIAPHPWSINFSLSDYSAKGKGTLVIGPPPSQENDVNLLKLLKQYSIKNFDILIKPKGNYLDSMIFWEKNGISTLSAGAPDYLFYERLASIISRYQTIVCPSISSALFFSASIGKNITVIPEYTMKVYENMNLLQEWDASSEKASNIVKTIISGNSKEICDLSQFLLGFDYLDEAKQITQNIDKLMLNLKNPFNQYKENTIPYFLREFLTIHTKKPRIMRMDFRDYFDLLSRGHVGVMTVCDFDMRLNGKNDKNFSLQRVKFIPGKTEPGFGYKQYLK